MMDSVSRLRDWQLVGRAVDESSLTGELSNQVNDCRKRRHNRHSIGSNQLVVRCTIARARRKQHQMARSKWLPKQQLSSGKLTRRTYLLCLVLTTTLLLPLINLSVVKCQQQPPQTAEGDEGTLLKGNRLPDLASGTSDEPVVAIVGQDAFISCVAKNLQNYTLIWRFTNDAQAPEAGKLATSDEQLASTILTAGRQRVTQDERFSVIQSHDTWLLKINQVRLSDTGTYICQANSQPRVRVLRILSVLRSTGGSSSGTNEDSADSPSGVQRKQHFDQIDYNFTDCCRAEFVAPRCQRLCSFQQLASRYQTINMVHECFSQLPSISRCMVAGRNVTDCCQKRHIPSRCKSMCGHSADTSALTLQDQTYCADYSAAIMSCVAEGISTLPGQPELVIVEAISSTTLKVSWQKITDEQELSKLDGWIINLTKLSSFADTISATTTAAAASTTLAGSGSSLLSSNSQPLSNLTIVDAQSSTSLATMTRLLQESAAGSVVSLKLDKTFSEFSIENLKPYTVYQIQMFAYNSRGRSQLTDPIRALTLAPENEQAASGESGENGDAYVEPSLPDTRKCCLDRGVTLRRCLDTLCDPVEADRATIADLMICAPWSNVTFGCLSSRVNHTDCCKARGVSPFCLSMCSADIKRVDYRHFRCLTHMSAYTSCILESHNVLASPPQNFTVGPITHTWAVLNWRAPKKHARSLQGYRIFWRRIDPVSSNSSSTSLTTTTTATQRPVADADDFYSNAEAATNPYLLDALQPDTVYETFVVAVNKFGQSESSSRFVFQTLADPEVAAQLKSTSGRISSSAAQQQTPDAQANQRVSSYNETTCCVNSGLHSSCLQLCSYDMRVADVSSLVTTCNTQMPIILRCMAGGRNSVPCCRNQRVSDHCLNTCAGLSEQSPLVLATRCAPDFGKIIRCMDEGAKQIPAAPVDLHTTDVTPNEVRIRWSTAPEDSLRTDVEYHVRYQQLQQTEPAQTSDLSSLIAVVPLHPLEHNLILSTNRTEAAIDKLRPGSRYSVYVTAENSYGISLPSLVLVVQTPISESEQTSTGEAGEQFKRRATLGAPHSLEVLRSDTESIVLRWIAPLFINSDAQVRYRVFYKLMANPTTSNSSSSSSNDNNSQNDSNNQAQPVQQVASNWTVVETGDTSVLLRNLRYSSQYVITVQAFSKQLLGHMSEILLVSTAKPVPPTLNQPLIINSPVEGNNITIMCVALGQPTPQISMFINGLLVQKRTQPYVIYHLVNLVRGQLTISCFASNGHGKDYASVQSRTEVSVRFGAKSVAKAREVRTNPMASARITCEVSGNPQPTVVWTFAPDRPTNSGSQQVDQQPSRLQVITPNERITTLLVSQFENPFTWSHTLTVRNVTSSDLGTYQCRARNSLAESVDSLHLSFASLPSQEFISSTNSQSTSNSAATGSSTSTTNSTNGQLSYLRQVEQNSDLMSCCRSQNVSAACLPVCSLDGLDVETAFKTSDCQSELNKLMFCAADGSDHRTCCRTRQVPSTCLRWCSGAKLSMPAFCFLSSAMDINQCFQEGRNLLPGPPRNVRVLLASDSDHNESVGGVSQSSEVATTTMNSNMFSVMDRLQQQQQNQQPSSSTSDTMPSGVGTTMSSSSNNPSVISSMVMMIGEHQPSGASLSNGDSAATADSSSSSTTPTLPGLSTNGPQARQNSEPLIVEWDPPSKNPSLVQYYRIFWRPFGSRELSRTVTNLTWIRLNDLNMNKIYEFVVKAANTHGSSVYSDPLTVKPAEVLAQSNSIGSAGLIWFMPSSSGNGSLLSRITMAICFATLFMFSSLAAVMFLERRGYLRRFASSKSNSSRISFANPAYLKDSSNGITDLSGNNRDNDNSSITWETGHSLDILAPPTSSPASLAPPLTPSVASENNLQK